MPFNLDSYMDEIKANLKILMVVSPAIVISCLYLFKKIIAKLVVIHQGPVFPMEAIRIVSTPLIFSNLQSNNLTLNKDKEIKSYISPSNHKENRNDTP